MQDILHPLATLHWKTVTTVRATDDGGLYSNYCIYLKDKIYIAVQPTLYSDCLYAFSADFTKFEILPVPVKDFAFVSYRSQLMLVGGRPNKLWAKVVCNTLWMSKAGENWEQFLPPMKTCRQSPLAVSTGNPECLIVAGGKGAAGEYLNTVEVLVEKEWFTVQPLPATSYICNFLVHRGILITNADNENSWYCCDVSALIESHKETGLWRKCDSPKYYDEHYYGSDTLTMVSVGNHLMAFTLYEEAAVKILSPSIHAWVDVGALPSPYHFVVVVVCTVLPTGELVMICEINYKEQRDMFYHTFFVYKASITCKYQV